MRQFEFFGALLCATGAALVLIFGTDLGAAGTALQLSLGALLFMADALCSAIRERR